MHDVGVAKMNCCKNIDRMIQWYFLFYDARDHVISHTLAISCTMKMEIIFYLNNYLKYIFIIVVILEKIFHISHLFPDVTYCDVINAKHA